VSGRERITLQRHESYASSSSSSSIREIKPVSYAFSYINSPKTAKQYPKRLQIFFNYLGMQGEDLEQQGRAFLEQARERGTWWTQEQIMMFMNSLKQRVRQNTSNERRPGEIAAGTLKNYIQPIKLLYEEHDLPPINWMRISRAMPKARKASNDRAPTREEIQKIVQAKDRRVKPIVCVMCSSGIRLGAWNYLRWKHVIPIKKEKKNKNDNKNDDGGGDNNNDEVIAAKLIVYTEEHDEHYAYVTPEAYYALKEWMDFRALHGEQITPESWLMRNVWQTADLAAKMRKGGRRKGGKIGLATSPKKLSIDAIKIILIRALYEQGVRQALPDGVKRHEWKGAHGFRKFFKTHAEQVMNHSNVELLIGHAPALQASYYKPTQSDVLADYLKAVDELTIVPDYHDKATLKKQVAALTEKSKEESYIIKGKLAEKEKEIEAAAREAEHQRKRMEDMQKEIDKIREIMDRFAPSEGLDRLFDEDRERRHARENNVIHDNE
jgi:hypothetical protein